MIRAVLIFIFCLWASTINAQDLFQDLAKIREKYFQPEGEVRFKLRMLFYDVKNLNQIEDSSQGSFRMAKSKTYADLENFISITNDSVILLVDKAEKRIFLSKNSKERNAFQFTPAIIDSLYNTFNLNVTLLPPSGRENKKYRLRIAEAEVDSIDLEYSSQSYLIKSFTLYYKKSVDIYSDAKPVIKVFYEDQVISDKINSQHFDMGKYVMIEKTTIPFA